MPVPRAAHSLDCLPCVSIGRAKSAERLGDGGEAAAVWCCVVADEAVGPGLGLGAGRPGLDRDRAVAIGGGEKAKEADGRRKLAFV